MVGSPRISNYICSDSLPTSQPSGYSPSFPGALIAARGLPDTVDAEGLQLTLITQGHLVSMISGSEGLISSAHIKTSVPGSTKLRTRRPEEINTSRGPPRVAHSM